MHSLNKRGLSQIISVLIIMTVSIIGIGIVGASINNITKSNLSPAFSCTQEQINPSVRIQSVCYNELTKTLETNLTRNINENFIGELTFSINSESWSCGPVCGGTCTILNPGAQKTYHFSDQSTLQTQPKDISIAINGCFTETKKVISC